MSDRDRYDDDARRLVKPFCDDGCLTDDNVHCRTCDVVTIAVAAALRALGEENGRLKSGLRHLVNTYDGPFVCNGGHDGVWTYAPQKATCTACLTKQLATVTRERDEAKATQCGCFDNPDGMSLRCDYHAGLINRAEAAEAALAESLGEQQKTFEESEQGQELISYRIENPKIAARLATVTRERDEAREANKRLNRRCQSAESGLKAKLEDIKRQGGSFGRALAASGYVMAENENAALRARVAALEAERDEWKARVAALLSGV